MKTTKNYKMSKVSIYKKYINILKRYIKNILKCYIKALKNNCKKFNNVL